MCNRTLHVPDVAVTGMGLLCKAGKNVSEVMATLYSGKRSAASPYRISCELDVVYPVFEVEQIPPAVTPGDSVSLCMLLHVVEEALAQAGLTTSSLAGKRVGICIGTTTGASLNFSDDYFAHKSDGWDTPLQVESWLQSNPAAGLSKALQLSGPCQTIVNACSSGADAIGLAMTWLQLDVCDIVLAGGVDELSPISYNGFVRLGVYDSQPCKPFDSNRKGLNLGEGAGLMVLEKRDEALQRGARLLGRCAGYGTAADAHHLTAPSPDGDGIRRAIASALKQAGVSHSDIDFVNAHGTATPDNDKVESGVLPSLFPQALVSATKGYTGHTLGAAGAIEAIFTVQALLDKKLPASAGFEISAEGLPIRLVSANTEINARYGLSESLAFGGNNSVLIFSGEE